MKGKKANGAAVRKLSAETEANIAAYQRKVRELTQANADLKDQMAREHEIASRTQRVLRAQLAEGLAPELKARDKRIGDITNELIAVRNDLRRRDRLFRSMFGLFVAVMQDAGMTAAEAHLWVTSKIPAAANLSVETALATAGDGLAAYDMKKLQDIVSKDSWKAGGA